MKKTHLSQLFIPGFLVLINLLLVFPWFADGYPPIGASMEPVWVAQARFIQDNWPQVAWNPGWYLGFPFQFAGSPLLPYLMALTVSLWPKLSLWFVYRLITGIGLLVMPLGVYWLIHDFTSEVTRKDTDSAELTAEASEMASKNTPGVEFADTSGVLGGMVFSFLPSVLFLFPQVLEIGLKSGFFPWHYFSLAYLGNGGKILGLALIPFCLLIIDRFLKSKLKRIIWPVLAVSLLALLDLSSVNSLVILVILRLISYAMVRKLGRKPAKAIRIFAFSFLILAFYYSPRFWWQHLSAPSLAGKRALAVFLFITRILSILLPISLAVFSAKFLKKKKKPLFLFSFLWVFVFGFLTLARFTADTDFWQDYTSWGVELGMGIALLATQLLVGFKFKVQSSKFKVFGVAVVILISSLLWLGNRNILLTPRLDMADTAESRVIKMLEENVSPGERVFLSGSPVFWLNGLADISQVRGGTDKGAAHPFWDHASYQIRVGEDPELSQGWLKALGVSWLVVHGPESEEPYHDFTFPEKFRQSSAFQYMSEAKGDEIYRVEAALARLLKEPDQFLRLEPPKDGADLEALVKYNSLLDGFIPFEWVNPSRARVILASSEPVSLAITYDLGWQAHQAGVRLKIKKDSLGQIVIFPQNNQPIILTYHWLGLDQLAGLIISGSGLFLGFKYSRKTKRSRVSHIGKNTSEVSEGLLGW